MNKPNIAVILGSIRQSRFGEKVAAWFMNLVQNHEHAQFNLVDLKSFNLPLFSDSVSPAQRTGTHPNPEVQKWIDTVAAADGFVFITPEYNHSLPGALKNAIDYILHEWNHKPMGIISYGSAAGGSRAAEHLRQVSAELQMIDVRDQVIIPFIWNAFNQEGKLENAEMHEKNAHNMINSIIKLSGQLRQKI